MSVFYTIGDSLYVNITNECPMNCTFCVRGRSAGVGSAGSLWLAAEPDAAQIKAMFLDAIAENAYFSEIVFCGYGEPTCRADCMLECAHFFRANSAMPLRLNTNGLVYLLHPGFDAARFGIFDEISISLNAPDAQSYAEICRPAAGAAAYEAMLAFCRDVREFSRVTLSVVNVLDTAQIAACRGIADGLGVGFRVRVCM